MRTVVGIFIVLAGIGAQVSWWEHILYVGIGLLVILVPSENKKPS